MAEGWKNATKSEKDPRDSCWHLGLFFATFEIYKYDPGSIWECKCGQEFVIVAHGKDNKDRKFVEKEKLDDQSDSGAAGDDSSL